MEGYMYRAKRSVQILVRSIRIFIIRCMSIAEHSHHERIDSTRTVILVCVKEDTETFEVVDRAKNRSLGSTLLCYPQGHAISMEGGFSVYFEFEFDLREYKLSFLLLRARECLNTSQFVAVRGILENIQPLLDAMSLASLTYLGRC